MDITVGFIGLGLIGGSIAKTLKKADGHIHTIAFNRSALPLEHAVKDGIIDTAVTKVDSEFSSCDFIFLCTPVQFNESYLLQLKDIIKDSCIITDVGSVKGHIHEAVRKLDMEASFIGGHPMAGSEKTGYDSSSDHLLENAYYAITPTARTREADLTRYFDLVKMMGAIPVILSPTEHDYAVAGISHLPHLIASSLVNLVKDKDNDNQIMKMLAAGGFRDITRIASSSGEMWEQICLTNSSQIGEMLGDYIQKLQTIKNYIETGDGHAINEMFNSSKNYRDSINVLEKGPIPRSYFFYLDIEDKEGAISEIASLLSANHISIKNIGIIHNRDYEQGVLRIDFYDEHSSDSANTILLDNGYTIYK